MKHIKKCLQCQDEELYLHTNNTSYQQYVSDSNGRQKNAHFICYTIAQNSVTFALRYGNRNPKPYIINSSTLAQISISLLFYAEIHLFCELRQKGQLLIICSTAILFKYHLTVINIC